MNSSQDLLIRPAVNWVMMVCHFKKAGSQKKRLGNTDLNYVGAVPSESVHSTEEELTVNCETTTDVIYRMQLVAAMSKLNKSHFVKLLIL